MSSIVAPLRVRVSFLVLLGAAASCGLLACSEQAEIVQDQAPAAPGGPATSDAGPRASLPETTGGGSYKTNFRGLELTPVDGFVETARSTTTPVKHTTIHLTDFAGACATYRRGERPEGGRELIILDQQPWSPETPLPVAPFEPGRYPLLLINDDGTYTRAVLPIEHFVDTKTGECKFASLRTKDTVFTGAEPANELVITEASATRLVGSFSLQYPGGQYARGTFDLGVCDVPQRDAPPECK